MLCSGIPNDTREWIAERPVLQQAQYSHKVIGNNSGHWHHISMQLQQTGMVLRHPQQIIQTISTGRFFNALRSPSQRHRGIDQNWKVRTLKVAFRRRSSL
mmetsp:Transcript_80015/g.144425  ORF Transcript_80015/g.144425 Transcript_80015/m.144425 type:complete len:100 (-) Transcript_80015:866-1165(-)